MNILLIEDDDDIRDLLALILETKLRANVMQSATVQNSLSMLKTGDNFDCIFSDYHLPDGNGGTIFKHLSDVNSQVPFILCSSETPEVSPHFRERKISGYIEKPFNTNTVVNTISQVLSEKLPLIQNLEQQEYNPIKIRTLLKANVISCDLFVKISDSKYVRLARAGDSFGRDDYNRYLSKNLESLYLRSSDAGVFLDRFARDAMSLSQVKTLPQNEAFEISKQNFELVQEAISSLGCTPEVQTLTQSCTSLAIRTISNDPATLPYFQNMPLNKQNFLSTHSILMVQTSCYLAHVLGWTSESTQYKLALASFLHDITLPDDVAAMIELNGEKSNPAFEKHPEEVMALVQKMKATPSDVDTIVLRHHERPNGIGFPRRLNSSQIEPLPSLFIVAHDLSNYLWLQEKNATISEFLQLYGNDYTRDHFKKIHMELSQLK